MEVKKLYYEDSHLTAFTATVLDCQSAKGGYAVTLDATAFYPEGGGQPCDLGTLAGAQVLEVKEVGEQVVHLCDQPLTPGSIVEGNIQWQRRFDLMQQHSGEHIVSGIIHSMFGYHNVGFHMGSELVTIDFDGMIPAETLEIIEEKANRAVWENLPLRVWYPSQQELPTVPYRRKKDLPWPVRIVEIPGIDLCACCGTQVKRTGEVGLIKLLSCVKFHQGVRIEMACGGRALGLLSQVWEQNKLVSQAFSAKILQTGQAASKMNQQLADEKFRCAGLQKRLFAFIASRYEGAENPVHLEEGLTPGQVRELADAIAACCAGIATVLSASGEDQFAVCMVSRHMDVRPAGQAAAAALNGRGGGKPEAFQGNLKATAAQVREYFRL